MPIICNQVQSGSTVHTDEHRSYLSLNSKGFIHGTVCHKYNFINRLTGVHTQSVEYMNNMIKIEIKKKNTARTYNKS